MSDEPGIPGPALAGGGAGGDFADWAGSLRPRLIALCRRFLWNSHDAEEIAQDALLLAWRESGRMRTPGRLGAWAYRTAVNLCVNRLRKRKPIALDSLERPSSSAGPLQTQADAELAERLRLAIEELPESLRVPVVLRDLEELEYDQIAAVMGIRAAGVRVRVHRAREALRVILLRRWPDAFGPD